MQYFIILAFSYVPYPIDSFIDNHNFRNLSYDCSRNLMNFWLCSPCDHMGGGTVWIETQLDRWFDQDLLSTYQMKTLTCHWRPLTTPSKLLNAFICLFLYMYFVFCILYFTLYVLMFVSITHGRKFSWKNFWLLAYYSRYLYNKYLLGEWRRNSFSDENINVRSRCSDRGSDGNLEDLLWSERIIMLRIAFRGKNL